MGFYIIMAAGWYEGREHSEDYTFTAYGSLDDIKYVCGNWAEWGRLGDCGGSAEFNLPAQKEELKKVLLQFI